MAAWEECPMPVLILTRPMAASRRFLEEVEAAMGRPVSHVISPVMKIVPIAVDDLADPVTGVVFTSENAVLQAERFGFAPGLPAWCVGDRTADVARREGFEARSAGGDA
jgi:uroporphyrinogen-III synthase